MSSIRISRGLVIHGGVGVLPRAALTPEVDAAYRAALRESLLAGHAALDAGGSAVEGSVAAVQVMENSPLFNAGRGSNFDERGVITMDASIMDGAALAAGGVAGVTDVRSPIELARLVMERSEHVLLIGEGAEAFARQQGIEKTGADFFHTDRRWEEMTQAKHRAGARPNVLGDDPADELMDDSAGAPGGGEFEGEPADDPIAKSGTVGAVALDDQGRLAAATSTGGMANKTWGRVGDSPLIGAGTYASAFCAVSCTGWGEFFIRNAAAYDVHARMKHAGATLTEAVRGVVFDTLEAQVPRSGGLVALDEHGNVELCYNTPGMYRGWVDRDGQPHVDIYRLPPEA